MSRRQFRTQASSGRAGTALGGFASPGFGTGQSSFLSFVQEPPDYGSIDDANAVVAFKNLSKKAETTKAKALEELQAYPLNGEVSEPFLEAWTRLFPRLSIDNARRVRQLAHTLNGQLCSKSGKRTAKYMPRIAGAWLAGTFDYDRATARAALDALQLVFPTAEKLYGVRKAFHRPILQYCRDAALRETVQTLSDERTVSLEDAKAIYARVVATNLSVINSLAKELSKDDRDSEFPLYEEIFGDARLWDFVYFPDAGVRRSMHRLVQIHLDKQPVLIQANIRVASTAYVYKGLHSDQTGSAADFVQTLEALTVMFPTLWTEAYSGKKSAASRLRIFLKQGSQSASVEFWDSLSRLFTELPEQTLPKTEEDILELLSSARIGISRKDNRLNLTAAWSAYFVLVNFILSHTNNADIEKMLDTQVMPVIRQFLFPAVEYTDWSITGPKAALTVSKAANINALTALLVREWPQLADKLIETAKLSQPEQSKDFDRSQRYVATTGERWTGLQRELWKGSHSAAHDLSKLFVDTNTKILKECISILKSRNGKPYGAAAVIEQLLRTCGTKLLSSEEFCLAYNAFAEDDIPGLIFSPSQRQLISGVYATESEPGLTQAFAAVLYGLLDADETTDIKVNGLRVMFAQNIPTAAAKVAQETSEFQRFLVQSIVVDQSKNAMSLFADLVKLQAVSSNTIDAILTRMTESLGIAEHKEAGLSGLEILSNTSESTVRIFMSHPGEAGEQLLPNLVRLEKSTDDNLADRAAALSSQLSSAVGDAASDRRYGAVVQNLEKVSETSLPIDAVHDLTNRLLGPERSIDDPSDLLPSLESWRSALCATLKAPRASLSVLSSLGGGVHLVHQDGYSVASPAQYDAEGLSQALRISLYVGKLLAETDLLDRLGDMKAAVLALLQVSLLVAEDNISVLGINDFWRAQRAQETETIVLEFIAEANRILTAYWKTVAPDLSGEDLTESSQFFAALEKLTNDENVFSPLSYYVAVASAHVYVNLFEHHGNSAEQVKRIEAILNTERSTRHPFRLVSRIVGFLQPLAGTQPLSKLCNELIADLTDLDIEKDDSKGLDHLVLLNAILRTQEDLVAGIAKQRLIFLVKRTLIWLDSGISVLFRSEVFKALAELLPAINDIYGEHWEQVLSFAIDTWAVAGSGIHNELIDEGRVLLTNTSLKLFGTLRKLSKSDEANDDLVDALNGKRNLVQDGLINLLLRANGANDEWHQPLMITNELLARQIASSPHKSLEHLDDLYPLLYASSRTIQQAAFDLLHKQIPSTLEQISFDAALDNKSAQLPEELLSLILEAPTLETLVDASFQTFMPLSLQGYLFSWRLLFDHFNGSSYRVRNDYVEQLKDGVYLPGLLSLTFDFLGHTRGRPVDVTKFDTQEYISDVEPSPEKDVQWLLTHLYFLALTHLPSLVKSYYLDIRSRQTSLAVETWTAKHISPLIIDASLRQVSEWSEKSAKEDPEYEKMTVKVGTRSREINVSYIVDEQTMAMKVVLPESYPLASAQVLGVSRVAVKEEKWQSWLRNCQGVITFSNGSITDGLSAWRKNVTGALKGQTECAICYSIISADKQLPTKRCPTCKNLFHSSCLLKWFKTSNASTCPLCRNPFNFN